MAAKKHQIERTLVDDITNALERKLGKPSRNLHRPLLASVVGAILAVDSTPAKVETAISRLETEFVDWNEVRVTSAREIAAAIRGVGQETEKADALRTILTSVFSDRHELYFDFLADMPDENIVAYLQTMSGLSRVFQQAVLVHALRKNALLVTDSTARLMKRVGLVPRHLDSATVSEALDSVVPKRRIFSFSFLTDRVAGEFCTTRKPVCQDCPLRVLCNSAKTQYQERRKKK